MADPFVRISKKKVRQSSPLLEMGLTSKAATILKKVKPQYFALIQGKTDDDYVFKSSSKSKKPYSLSHFTRIVNEWLQVLVEKRVRETGNEVKASDTQFEYLTSHGFR